MLDVNQTHNLCLIQPKGLTLYYSGLRNLELYFISIFANLIDVGILITLICVGSNDGHNYL